MYQPLPGDVFFHQKGAAPCGPGLIKIWAEERQQTFFDNDATMKPEMAVYK